VEISIQRNELQERADAVEREIQHVLEFEGHGLVESCVVAIKVMEYPNDDHTGCDLNVVASLRVHLVGISEPEFWEVPADNSQDLRHELTMRCKTARGLMTAYGPEGQVQESDDSQQAVDQK
jgi:hypothetical protein